MDDRHKKDTEQEMEQEAEIIHDEPEIEDIEDRLEDKLKAVKTKLHECETAKAELHENLQRAKADFLNSRRRLEEQSQRNVERATDDLLIDLLPLLDSFDTALGDALAVGKLDPEWQKGIGGIKSLLTAFLTRNGVTEIEASGKHFNPHEHEALTNVPVHDETQADTVITVLQKGYKRNDTVLRPAKVTVGVHTSP